MIDDLPESTALRRKIECCPDLQIDQPCDILDFHYRQIYTTNVQANDRRIQVEVTINTRLERCPGPLAIGDLVYTTTLLPGEKVRLFSQDRRTRFSFDSATQLSYRSQQTSEERYYMTAMSNFMSDLSVRDEAHSSNKSHGDFYSQAEASGAFESFFCGPDISVSGNYNAAATSDFLRSLSQHVSASENRSCLATRAANSVTIGEVQSRSHAEGQSEDHFESTSRIFSNPNECHAITFFFYQINKTQTVRFKLMSIDRRVIDPSVNTKVVNNPFTSFGKLAMIPYSAPMNDLSLAKTIENVKTINLSRDQAVASTRTSAITGVIASGFIAELQPLIIDSRQKALNEVDKQLVAAGLLDSIGGSVSPDAQRKYSFEIHSSLPTPGITVKGCRDECDICEPALKMERELRIERQRLENELLKRQIELLEKSQEYRCCPGESNPLLIKEIE